MSTENTHLNELLQILDLNALIKEPTCYIDHFLTNLKKLFKHCQTFKTGLSDHLKLISMIMKLGIFKGLPMKIDNECFSSALREEWKP